MKSSKFGFHFVIITLQLVNAIPFDSPLLLETGIDK